MTHFVHVPPGVGVTFFGNLPGILDPEVIAACDFVCLHTMLDRADHDHARRVRALGCSRVWIATPANYLVRRMSDDAAVSEVQRAARIARDLGAEVFELNGEGTSDGEKPGDWIVPLRDLAGAARLEVLAQRIMDAARAVAGDRMALAWTSHDGTGFRVPRAFLQHPALDLHAPQHYPALPRKNGAPPRITQRGMEKRVAWSEGQWQALAARGVVPPDVCPHGARWTMYTQAHGLTVGAMAWALCEAPTARLWAYPSSADRPEMLAALRVARAIRRDVDVGKPDAIERWQAAKGLVSDGIVGRATISAALAVV